MTEIKSVITKDALSFRALIDGISVAEKSYPKSLDWDMVLTNFMALAKLAEGETK